MLKKLTYLLHKYVPYFHPQVARRRRRMTANYQFTNRQKGQKELLMLICGYKEELWEPFFSRIKSFTPDNVDICIVCPGFAKHDALASIAEKNNWSILCCTENKLSVAQNITIRSHEKAETIYKLDEDIFIASSFFEGMRMTHHKAKNQSLHQLGFVAPLIHVNGYSYHRLLDLLNKTKDYEGRFGPIVSSCIDIPAWSDGDAAEFLWDAIHPLDQTASSLYQKKGSFSVCPHRFSIGAIMFSREVWEDLDYFIEAPEGYLGLEEIQLAEYCARECKQIIVSEEVLVGHFSFGPQYEHMLEVLKKKGSSFLEIRP